MSPEDMLSGACALFLIICSGLVLLRSILTDSMTLWGTVVLLAMLGVGVAILPGGRLRGLSRCSAGYARGSWGTGTGCSYPTPDRWRG